MSRFILTISLILFLFGRVSAGIIRVPENHVTIQTGINAASKGDTVLVADGTYYENINFKGKAITLASQFLIDGDAAHIDNTIINGSKPSHSDTGSVVLFISGEDTTSVLCGFTITGGKGSLIAARRRGGGICIFQSGARVVRNKIIKNVLTSSNSVFGGGICAGQQNNSFHIIVENNLITDNKASSTNTTGGYGGGIDISTPHFRIIDNIISHNFVSGSGSAFGPSGRLIYAAASSKFQGNTISYNYYESVMQNGGLMVGVTEDGFTIEKNYFRGNKGGSGGALITWDCNVIIQNNIFYDNFASSYGNGGAIYIMSIAPFVSNVQLINNTIVQNKALNTGGGLFTTNSATRVMNTIFWGNSASNGPQIHHRESGTLDVIYSDIQGGWFGSGNIGLDPAFVPNDTLFHLSENSPCIDKGISSTTIGGMACCCPCEDFDGHCRPYGAEADIGAQESVPTRIELAAEFGLPAEYLLDQNYPNPFNPSTTISFKLPQSSFVMLKIYNVLGKEVASLVSERLTAANYQYHWNATGMAAGVYFYQLRTDKFSQTKKMILMP